MSVHSAEDNHMAELASKVLRKSETISGFEALALLNWHTGLDLSDSHSTLYVELLANMAGLDFAPGVSIATGQETTVELDGQIITLPAKETIHYRN